MHLVAIDSSSQEQKGGSHEAYDHSPREGRAMGSTEFNVLVENEEQFRAELNTAGCGTNEAWAGEDPLRATISRTEWVSQLHPEDEVSIS